ncbi:glycoside hydrolase family 99-like domain-containing protein [uncultured Polaribacter sp.]|uniref:glycosyltransferase WbsX family protein n=1 Tax=uncultured Polaribacter sp. TaxID=174711 RepID=UPI0026229DB2|nr:glycoside hydrolase family 99-like domain-containing protein [uncultured Polaribacter sp.]
MSDKLKAIAIYLPQYHPIRENDKWWGKGFTEWTNVVKSKPRFKNHYQPHLPADLGFYDLRLEEIRIEQAKLAKKYGLHGFCYYHYWFNGKRMLERPFEEVFKSGKPNFPFMLCWANENWTGTWDGGNNKILLKQNYSKEDDLAHIKYLIKYFKDDRYIKVKGKPVFIIYRPILFPNLNRTIEIWRKEVKKAGFPDLYLGYSQNSEYSAFPENTSFDFAFNFQPSFTNVPIKTKNNIILRLLKKISKKIISNRKKIRVFDYEEYASLQMKNTLGKNVFPGITPMWDNSARKTNSFVLHNSTPTKYGIWLKYLLDNYKVDVNDDNFLFINAWNEWAEGNHLEPCKRWGLEYLKVTKNLITNFNK